MSGVERTTKYLVFVSLFALFIWVTYFLIDSLNHFVNLSLGLQDWYAGKEWYFFPAFLGIVMRFLGVVAGLVSAVLVWNETKSFFKVKNLVTAGLILEAMYHFSMLPSSWSLIIRNYHFLGFAYILQASLTTPSLTVLAIKLKGYPKPAHSGFPWKWCGYASASYIAALGINAIFRWFDMAVSEGVTFLFMGLGTLGFLNTLLLMPCAIGLATLGGYYLSIQKKSQATLLFGLASTAVGLHYVIYVFYSYFSGALKFALLTDVWTIPFLGLGLSMAKSSIEALEERRLNEI